MNYIIDGYNLFFHIEKEVNPLKKKREDFIIVLNKMLKHLHLHAIIIFDSQQAHATNFPTKKRLSALEIIFSPKDLTADEYILERLTVEKKPQTQIIVSSDRALCRQVQILGAKTITIKDFFQMLTSCKIKKLDKEEKIEQESSYHHNRLLQAFEERLRNESSD